MMKNFRNRGLLESPDHKIYSFRHAFEKRMQEANCDLSAQVHNVAGAPVRQAARERLKGWETDARALAAAADSQ